MFDSHDHTISAADRIQFLPDLHWLHDLEDHIVHNDMSAEMLLMAAVVCLGGWIVGALTVHSRRRPMSYRAW